MTEEPDCETCQSKFLDYGIMCVDCEPWNPKLSNYKHYHENEETDEETIHKQDTS